MSLVAARLATRPAAGSMTFGLGRAEILSAQANGVTLLILGVLIVVDAIRRLFSPPEVDGLPVLIVALVGIVVNLVAARVLARRLRGAAQPQHRGLLPAHPHRPVRLHRDRGRRGRDPGDGVRPRGRDRLAADRRDPAVRGATACSSSRAGCSWRPRRRAWTRRRSAACSPPSRASSRSTICTCGRSPRAFRRSRRTSSYTSTTTATSVRRRLQQVAHDRFGITHTTLQVDHEAAPQPPLQIELPSAPGH